MQITVDCGSLLATSAITVAYGAAPLSDTQHLFSTFHSLWLYQIQYGGQLLRDIAWRHMRKLCIHWHGGDIRGGKLPKDSVFDGSGETHNSLRTAGMIVVGCFLGVCDWGLIQLTLHCSSTCFLLPIQFRVVRVWSLIQLPKSENPRQVNNLSLRETIIHT